MGAADLRIVEPALAPWNRLDEDVEFAPLQGASGIGEATCLVRVAAGGRLNTRGRLKIVELLVVEGTLERDGGRHGVGDFLTFDDGPAAVLSAGAAAGFSILVTASDTDPTAGAA